MLKFSPQGGEPGCDLQMNSWRTKTSSWENIEYGWIWTNMDEYGWIWMNMDEYGRIWMNMDEYGWIWMNMDEYGRIWMNMDEYGWIWTNMDEYGWIWTNMDEYGWIWMNMDEYGWIWMNMDEYGRIWMNMDEYGWIWTNMDEYGWIWSCNIEDWSWSITMLKKLTDDQHRVPQLFSNRSKRLSPSSLSQPRRLGSRRLEAIFFVQNFFRCHESWLSHVIQDRYPLMIKPLVI